MGWKKKEKKRRSVIASAKRSNAILLAYQGIGCDAFIAGPTAWQHAQGAQKARRCTTRTQVYIKYLKYVYIVTLTTAAACGT